MKKKGESSHRYSKAAIEDTWEEAAIYQQDMNVHESKVKEQRKRKAQKVRGET